MTRLPLLLLTWCLSLPLGPPLADATGSAPPPVAPNPSEPIAGPLDLPAPGSARLDLLSPRVVQVAVFDDVAADARPPRWDWARGHDRRALPAGADLRVEVAGQRVGARATAFVRRARHVPREGAALRLESRLIVSLDEPAPESALVRVQVRDPAAPRRPALALEARLDPARPSRAIHVSQAGYAPRAPKRATVGHDLGEAGDLPVEADAFTLVDAHSGATAYRGRLTPRPERGDGATAYPHARDADFTAMRTPGRYRLCVPGLGCSAPFAVDAGAPWGVTRAFALGLLHQRCGEAIGLPFTRFSHAACHTAPAERPRPEGGLSRWLPDAGAAGRQGLQDVQGGHHDAGDYGKYVPTTAELVHALTLAVDTFPGVAEVDDLGLPESGDGEPDLLGEAARAAAFLARMQAPDGAFYTFVRPRDRAYEDDVMPERGDPQALAPTSSVATAAACAALAQISASPAFRARHPRDAATWLAVAERGWKALEARWAAQGRAGAFTRVHHYGEVFEDRDEIAWAAVELYLATGDARYRDEALPVLRLAGRPEVRRWGWWRLFEGYGAAFRSCALAAESGRAHAFAADVTAGCRREVLAGAQDVAAAVEASAFGAPLPLEDKRHETAGWFFASDRAFDLLVGHRLAPERGWLAAYGAAQAFETGANPRDICFVSGLGDHNGREIVHQVAWNDRQAMPPTGLPVGNVVAGFERRTPLLRHADALSWPPDDDRARALPLYERATDAVSTAAEPVTARLARSLAGSTWYARSTADDVEHGAPLALTLERTAPGTWRVEPLTKLDALRLLWEGGGVSPRFAGPIVEAPPGTAWLEVEAIALDGRRAFATWEAPPPPPARPGEEGAP